jgi:GDP-L-fucose synthase
MQRDSKIYVAGDSGLVGSAPVRRLNIAGYSNIAIRKHAELDLTDPRQVRDFFERERPEYVFMAAARVGGIVANNSFPAEFIRQNLAIQLNVIDQCWRSEVNRLIFLGSSCIYPRECPQPIKEEYLLTGPLESTNRPYAVAKIAGIEQCWAYNRQYGTQYLAVMPTNLYGPGDHYHPSTSHVLPALIRKAHEAKITRSTDLVVWGTGSPRREFLYVEDMADACLFLANLPEAEFRSLLGSEASAPLINVGYGSDLTIRELADLVARIVGFIGRVVFDSSKPDGTPRKWLDSNRILRMGWKPATNFEEGIRRTYDDFIKAHANDNSQVVEGASRT